MRRVAPDEATLAERAGHRVQVAAGDPGNVKVTTARDYADATTTPDTKFGFHLPPFNSVDHLHMHAFALPFDPPWKEHKYGGVLGSVAFAEATDVIERLEREEAEAAAAEAEAGRRSNL